jgi:hypothetical protein
MKSGVLWINGQPVKRERIADYVDENGKLVTRYIETLPNGVSHTILEAQEDSGMLDNTEEFRHRARPLFRHGRQSRRFPRQPHLPCGSGAGGESGRPRRHHLLLDRLAARAGGKVWKWPFAIRYGRLFDLVK